MSDKCEYDAEITEEEDKALNWLSNMLQRLAEGGSPAARVADSAHSAIYKILENKYRLHDALHAMEQRLAVAEGVLEAIGMMDIDETEFYGEEEPDVDLSLN